MRCHDKHNLSAACAWTSGWVRSALPMGEVRALPNQRFGILMLRKPPDERFKNFIVGAISGLPAKYVYLAGTRVLKDQSHPFLNNPSARTASFPENPVSIIVSFVVC